ncbi:hypothetical protein PBY51_004511 [Eleginops maclovinus]|uniref:Uncharacterized protein n=1 Tax=Eleginops maclovinus TaxID=56733 RepID=A0AAN7Y2W2_ELEMC|nr:hypothetical protein PBY51_004511 [Eleginops maclovinus]
MASHSAAKTSGWRCEEQPGLSMQLKEFAIPADEPLHKHARFKKSHPQAELQRPSSYVMQTDCMQDSPSGCCRCFSD